jgi:hypothetical protein
MNVEWIKDYEAKEYENVDRFLANLGSSADSVYPQKVRFVKLSGPIATFTVFDIWPKIPLYKINYSLHPILATTKSTD